MPSTEEFTLHCEQDRVDLEEIRRELSRLNSLRAWAAGCFAVVSIIAIAIWQAGPWLIRSAVRDSVESLDVAKKEDMQRIEDRIDSLERRYVLYLPYLIKPQAAGSP